jgi:hypothetical protein
MGMGVQHFRNLDATRHPEDENEDGLVTLPGSPGFKPRPCALAPANYIWSQA